MLPSGVIWGARGGKRGNQQRGATRWCDRQNCWSASEGRWRPAIHWSSPGWSIASDRAPCIVVDRAHRASIASDQSSSCDRASSAVSVDRAHRASIASGRAPSEHRHWSSPDDGLVSKWKKWTCADEMCFSGSVKEPAVHLPHVLLWIWLVKLLVLLLRKFKSEKTTYWSKRLWLVENEFSCCFPWEDEGVNPLGEKWRSEPRLVIHKPSLA